jgi:hypothetical protein
MIRCAQIYETCEKSNIGLQMATDDHHLSFPLAGLGDGLPSAIYTVSTLFALGLTISRLAPRVK